MSLKIQLYLLSFVILVGGTDIIVKLDTKQVIQSLLSETSVKYLTELAQVFAKKAAETFISEIKNREHLLKDSGRAQSATKSIIGSHRIYTTTKKSILSEESILNEEEAYKLLEQPSPDGDNLGWHSREISLEEEDHHDRKTVPVYGLMKVNGVYVRRLLGLGSVK